MRIKKIIIVLGFAMAISLLIPVYAHAMSGDAGDALRTEASRGNTSALKQLRQAASIGDSTAEFELGHMYDNGQGVLQDYVQAAKWYRKAADQGDARAQLNLGVLYFTGSGVLQDYALAVQWYRKAADQGNARAQNYLGTLYDYGQVVPLDYALAAQWYRKAADQGDADAQYSLGMLYDYDQGVPQNYVVAYALYNLSASKDISRINTNRDNLAFKMTEADIEAAQSLTQQMIAKGVTSAINSYFMSHKKVKLQKRKHQ